MADYKLSFTAAEIDEKLRNMGSGVCLPMVSMVSTEVASGSNRGIISEETNSALNAAWETGLPCILVRNFASGGIDTTIMSGYSYGDEAEYCVEDNYVYLYRETPDSQWTWDLRGE